MRVTKLIRTSLKSHDKVKRFAKKHKTTMSKALDYIIKKYFKNHKFYEDD